MLWPASCLVCRRPLKEGVLCRRCLPEPLDLIRQPRCVVCFCPAVALDACQRCELCALFPPVFGRIRFLWHYRGNARDLITCMKYKPSLRLCRNAAQALAERIFELFPCPDWDMIVPLPASIQSERERCFNQCLVIARALCSRLGAQGHAGPETSALFHQGCRHAQASLAHNRRILNVKNAFRAEPSRVCGAHILLVDDVITTGATGATAAVCLLRAGAATVDLIALAKAGAWDECRHEIYQKIR